ncbi:MAG: transglycosylase domain-containing protein [Oscillospiraceae bacterium]|jgi:penicillin-binding protein 1A|nr:transglycosylase domain-containing protein [Oscillospiraceae bacterium]
MDKVKAVLHKIKCFFIAVWRTVKKGARKIFSPEIKPGVKRVSRMFGAVLGVFARILLVMLLIFVLTGAMIGVFGAIYVTRYLDVNTDIDLNQFDLDLTSHIYAKDPDNPGQYILLESLSGKENRIWVPYDEIPRNIIDAVVAIEDERYWSHEGVDWKRTIGAFYTLFQPGSSQFGGSTITQQLIKNLTGEKDATVARKLQEIFRALAFERTYPGVAGKELILEYYLNTVHFGSRCDGIVTAAEQYFGKALNELTLAECAALVGITNNPSVYNPYSNPKNNKRRQETILFKMHDLQMITRHEYNMAKYEPLTFARRENMAGGDRLRSWYVDQIIRDVTVDLMEEWGWSPILARQYIFSAGVNIYACIDLNIQAAMDAIWADDSCWPASPDAEPAEAAMMVIDHTTGEIKAMIGGREKTGNLVFDLSTQAKRSPGSSIKPITVYAPAFDLGLITPYSPVDDMPVQNVDNRGWPKNSPVGYDGHMNILRGVTVSKNTVAVQITDMVSVEKSFEYATERFGLTTLIESKTFGNQVMSDLSLSPLGMGSLTEGATVREMTGAYAAIANRGLRNKTRTYTHITDQTGAIVFENKSNPVSAIKDKAAYYMETCLVNAVESGTGRRARLDNMPVAGKTGTTSANKDRWFAGYTPYYTAVCWFGYSIGRDMNYYNNTVGNPAVHMWRQVMEKAHEGLERKEFEQPVDMRTFTYCIDSGLPPSDLCRLDPRGGRTSTGVLDKDDIPRSTCNVHTAANICIISNQIATPFCPPEMLKKTTLLNLVRWSPIPNFALGDEQYTLRLWQGAVPEPEPEDEEQEAGGVPVAGTGDAPRYRVVSVGADGKTPYNAFCVHCVTNAPPPITDPDGGENGGEPEGPGGEPTDPTPEGGDPGQPDATPPPDPDEPAEPPANWWDGLFPSPSG